MESTDVNNTLIGKELEKRLTDLVYRIFIFIKKIFLKMYLPILERERACPCTYTGGGAEGEQNVSRVLAECRA